MPMQVDDPEKEVGRTPEVVPVAEERVRIGKRRVETPVRVETTVREREESVEMPALREEIDVERVSVGRYVDAPAPIRQEGNVTIVPLHEEVLVVQKKILLREEVRIVRRSEERRESFSVPVRSEEARIVRGEPREIPGGKAGGAGGPGTSERATRDSLTSEKETGHVEQDRGALR
jgi:uncharacterized protein (TIGR02271 family)